MAVGYCWEIPEQQTIYGTNISWDQHHVELSTLCLAVAHSDFEGTMGILTPCRFHFNIFKHPSTNLEMIERKSYLDLKCGNLDM